MIPAAAIITAQPIKMFIHSPPFVLIEHLFLLYHISRLMYTRYQPLK